MLKAVCTVSACPWSTYVRQPHVIIPSGSTLRVWAVHSHPRDLALPSCRVPRSPFVSTFTYHSQELPRHWPESLSQFCLVRSRCLWSSCKIEASMASINIYRTARWEVPNRNQGSVLLRRSLSENGQSSVPTRLSNTSHELVAGMLLVAGKGTWRGQISSKVSRWLFQIQSQKQRQTRHSQHTTTVLV
jgi:hypothetical protein